MKKRTSVLLHLLLLIIVFVELAGRFTDDIRLEYPVKPLILIWMAVYFILFRQKKAYTGPILLAFFFSWVGDIMLMLTGKNELFFYAGAGGFFLAQLAYIYTFIVRREKRGRGFLQHHPVIGFFFIAYIAGIYYLLYPGLEGIMRTVVFLYALSIIGMSMMALNRNGRVGYTSYLLVFIGSILFVVSDSLLAFNKFYLEFHLAGFWIMITYISAQYLIMRGLAMEK